MLTVELIYRCRNCKQTFTIHTKGVSGDCNADVIRSQSCKNCCLSSTDGAVITIVADFIKFISLEK